MTNTLLALLMTVGALVPADGKPRPHKSSSIRFEQQNHLNFYQTLLQQDSSNYNLKIVKPDVPYAQLRFEIVAQDNTPLDAYIIIEDDNGALQSGMLTEHDGKVLYFLWDEKAKYITVTQMGFGKVKIPVEQIRNRIVDIAVKLYHNQ